MTKDLLDAIEELVSWIKSSTEVTGNSNNRRNNFLTAFGNTTLLWEVVLTTVQKEQLHVDLSDHLSAIISPSKEVLDNLWKLNKEDKSCGLSTFSLIRLFQKELKRKLFNFPQNVGTWCELQRNVSKTMNK